MNVAEIPLLTRREIEASIVAPIAKALISELGRETALALVRDVVQGISQDQGAALAQFAGANTLDRFSAAIDLWKQGGALELDMVEQSPERLSFNVTRCKYAEMYHNMGIADLGLVLSCSRDSALVHGFNPEVVLTRTQTIMEGADYCDFRFSLSDRNA